MKYLSGIEEVAARAYFDKAQTIAKLATCERGRCGSVIVQSEVIIGTGFNSPPHHLESQRRCSIAKDSYNKKVSDKTCCIHAEQRAILDALTHHPEKLSGSRLYFIRLESNDEKKYAGKPYCTICSKMSLDAGIAEFVLWEKDGICVYDTEEYNTLSYQYDEEKKKSA